MAYIASCNVCGIQTCNTHVCSFCKDKLAEYALSGVKPDLDEIRKAREENDREEHEKWFQNQMDFFERQQAPERVRELEKELRCLKKACKDADHVFQDKQISPYIFEQAKYLMSLR